MGYLRYAVLILGFLFVSCVPTKDLIYLQQKDDAAAVGAIAQVTAKPYRVQIHDVLSIVIKSPNTDITKNFYPVNSDASGGQSESGLYFTGFTVDDHGNIRIPMVGEINVLGFTIEEIRAAIETKLLAEFFTKEANIFVTVKLAGFSYTTNGEVGSPGTKTLFKENVNIMEAIANSGDITLTGDRKNVLVIRQYAGGAEIHSIDLTDINAMQSPYYNLQPNDYIYVKPLKQKSWGTGVTGIQSLGTIISILTLVTTTFLLLSR